MAKIMKLVRNTMDSIAEKGTPRSSTNFNVMHCTKDVAMATSATTKHQATTLAPTEYHPLMISRLVRSRSDMYDNIRGPW